MYFIHNACTSRIDREWDWEWTIGNKREWEKRHFRSSQAYSICIYTFRYLQLLYFCACVSELIVTLYDCHSGIKGVGLLTDWLISNGGFSTTRVCKVEVCKNDFLVPIPFPLLSNHSHSHSHPFPFQHCIPIPIFPSPLFPFPFQAATIYRLP